MRNILFLILFFCLQSSAQNNFWLARSKGKLPMLSYGLGEDRLGGTKLGYLDTNVLLKVIDSTKEMYQVQLSKFHTAYLEKNYVKADTLAKQKPFYLTNSWSVKGNEEGYDVVTISMDERLPYKSWMEIGPSKIILELYGVQSNTNWITQLQSAKEVKNIYFNQTEDDVVRVTIELIHQQQWGYSVGYKGKALTIKVKQKPASLNIKKLVIAVDAGHGGTNTGATGIKTKLQEKNFTLEFALALQKYLKKKKVEVVMVRTKDTSIDNKDRVLFLQEQKLDLLISLHLNSSSKTEVQGVSTYYKHIGYRNLTTSIYNRMLELDLKEFGNIGNFNFALNAPTDFPNCLVEIAFLSNEEDEQKIINPKFHKQVAKQIYLGIKDFLRKAN
jgi:N-acetylmuramoyl-L-alanine amidase